MFGEGKSETYFLKILFTLIIQYSLNNTGHFFHFVFLFFFSSFITHILWLTSPLAEFFPTFAEVLRSFSDPGRTTSEISRRFSGPGRTLSEVPRTPPAILTTSKMTFLRRVTHSVHFPLLLFPAYSSHVHIFAASLSKTTRVFQ